VDTEVSLAGAITSFAFELRNIGYPEQYTQAIIDKQAAEQAMLKAEFEKQTVIIIANATAQQVVIQANAEAEAKVLVANGTREAIELILEASGGDPANATRIAELYLWVETLKQIAPDIDVFITRQCSNEESSLCNARSPVLFRRIWMLPQLLSNGAIIFG